MVRESKYKVFLPHIDDADERLEVGINGTMYLLKRGEEISVSPEIYEVLKNAGMIRQEETA